jgi:transcriptional regulator with XRE-family HTH domain
MQKAKMKRKKHNSHLAANIRALRKAKGWKSIGKFAEALDMPVPTLRDIEAGYSQGYPETRRKIAEKLGVAEADLFRDPQVPLGIRNAKSKAESLGVLTAALSRLDENQLDTVIDLVETKFPWAFHSSTGSDT